MTYERGTRVRLLFDLGAVRADGSTPAGRFEPGRVEAGTLATVVDHEDENVDAATVTPPAALVEWFYVRPDDHAELVVPACDGFVEKYEEPELGDAGSIDRSAVESELES